MPTFFISGSSQEESRKDGMGRKKIMPPDPHDRDPRARPSASLPPISAGRDAGKQFTAFLGPTARPSPALSPLVSAGDRHNAKRKKYGSYFGTAGLGGGFRALWVPSPPPTELLHPGNPEYDLGKSPIENLRVMQESFLAGLRAASPLLSSPVTPNSSLSWASKPLPPIAKSRSNLAAQKQGATKDLAASENRKFRSELVTLVAGGFQKNSSPTNTGLPDKFEPNVASNREIIQKYYYYITYGVDSRRVADMDPTWLRNVLRLVPACYKERFPQSVKELSNEMIESYHLSVKKAIVDFVLRDPRARNALDDDLDAGASFLLDQSNKSSTYSNASQGTDDQQSEEPHVDYSKLLGEVGFFYPEHFSNAAPSVKKRATFAPHVSRTPTSSLSSSNRSSRFSALRRGIEGPLKKLSRVQSIRRSLSAFRVLPVCPTVVGIHGLLQLLSGMRVLDLAALLEAAANLPTSEEQQNHASRAPDAAVIDKEHMPALSNSSEKTSTPSNVLAVATASNNNVSVVVQEQSVNSDIARPGENQDVPEKAPPSASESPSPVAQLASFLLATGMQPPPAGYAIPSVIAASGFKDVQLDARTFRHLILRQTEAARDYIINELFPQLLAVFYSDVYARVAWCSLPPSRLVAFFNLVDMYIANAIRSAIRQAIIDYVNFFDLSRHGDNSKLNFGARLVLVPSEAGIGYRISIEPSLEETTASLEQIFDLILTSLDKVPPIDHQVFGWKSTEPLAINFEATYPDFVAEERTRLAGLLYSLRVAPPRHLELFSDLSPLLTGQFATEIAVFLSENGGLSQPADADCSAEYITEYKFDSFIAEAKKYQSMASFNILAGRAFKAHFPLFVLDCQDLLMQLYYMATRISREVMDHVSRHMRCASQYLIRRYRDIADRLVQPPSNIEETAALQAYLQTVRKEEAPALEALVQKIRVRLNSMIQYYDMLQDDYDEYSTLFFGPQKLAPLFTKCDELIHAARQANEEELNARREKYRAEIEVMSRQVGDFAQLSDPDEIQKYLKIAHKFQAKLDSISERVSALCREETLFGIITPTVFPELEQTSTQFYPYISFYQAAVDFQRVCSQCLNGPLSTVNAEKVESELSVIWKTIYKTIPALGATEPANMARGFKDQVDSFKKHGPLLRVLCNPGLRERHWSEISDVVGFRILPDSNTSFRLFVEMSGINLTLISSDASSSSNSDSSNPTNTQELFNKLERLETVASFATKEHSFEKALQKMFAEWQNIAFAPVAYRDTGTSILSAIDDIQMLLDDHIVKTQAMRGSPFIKPFEAETRAWDTKLNYIQEVFDEWFKVQMTWLYLEPIFSSEDIMRQMPNEGKRFRCVDETWREIMKVLDSDPRVMSVVSNVGDLLERLKNCNTELEIIQKGLNHYLEVKRLYFPRFFFLSNDEMLEILSETRDPLRVQPHLKKCFEGINSLEFKKPLLEICGMYSALKEYIEFETSISTADACGAVEKWLLDVEKNMLSSMRLVIAKCCAAYADLPITPETALEARAKWVLAWPGQAVLTTSQIFWTRSVESAIAEASLKSFTKISADRLASIVELVRGNLTRVARSTLEALVVVDVHARDIVTDLYTKNISNVTNFEWLSQMRYYYQTLEQGVTVQIVNSVVKYGYEYLGNTGRLVITPLTDRCFRTLLGALQLNLGGAPEGPAGTGKTESVKDLAKALAKQCVVYNCSDGLDYIAMGKFFKGLASSGAWACFDEFNRIDLEVLSVVAQQILTIQRARAAAVETFMFEGTELKLNPGCAVFITMNPGYAGRSELPDNLKSLFRPVAMMVPDYTLIAEISLYSFGFVDARNMAVKITATYRLCSEQLSSQDHYDYGMRAVKSVLNAAGALKLRFPKENESVLILRSIYDVNLPKFLAQDLPLFTGITSDLFPGVMLPKSNLTTLLDEVHKQCAEMHLQPTTYFCEKILQVYEMMLVRHGFMLVGEAFSGKTSCYRVLAAAMSTGTVTGLDCEKVLFQVMNPKSLTMGNLYGQFDAATHEWSDGVLALCFRGFASNPSPERKWVVFDGPIDAVWIENMNTVLDDNKKLCLNSGEIIQLSNMMSMIFEVRDLAVASPATVSRCGMIYMEPQGLGWRPLFTSWLAPTVACEKHATAVQNVFEKLVDPCLEFLRRNCTEVCPTLNSSLICSAMTIFGSIYNSEKEPDADHREDAQINDIAVFALTWGIGGVLNTQSQQRFSTFLSFEISSRSNEIPCTISGIPSLFDVAINFGKWKTWADMVPSCEIPATAKYSEILIPTVDTVRYTYLMGLVEKKNSSVLFVGSTGTGKTMYVKDALKKKDKAEYLSYQFTFSAQTSAQQTQEFLESKFEKRRKGVYGPPVGKKGIVFVDDLNMPAREAYGAQPPIELLRQWMDHSGWYNLGDKSFQEFVDIQFIAAMGPPGGGRNPVTSRFLRHFCTFAINQFDNKTLCKIFNEILSWHFKKDFSEDVASLRNGIVEGTLAIYKKAAQELLPTPKKSHYTFNLRDFARVIQGIMLSSPRCFTEKNKMIRLWVHEVMRVFYDRLVEPQDRTWLFQALKETTSTCFKQEFDLALERYDFNKDGSVGEGDLRQLLFGTGLGATAINASHDTTGTTANAPASNIAAAAQKIYDEAGAMDAVKAMFDSSLAEYNALSKKPMELVLFAYAIEHLVRISRVLMQPQGHILCVGVGGSGRMSLARLAAYIGQYELFQVEITKSYTRKEWLEDLKKIMKSSGAAGKPTVFLFSDTQIQHESFLEDINNILNSGEVPNVFASDEKPEIIEAVRKDAVQKTSAEDPASIFAYFLDRCRENLHVVLCMSPVGEAFRVRLRKFPSIVNCCTIDWYQAWPDDALEMVASTALTGVEMDSEMKSAVVGLCRTFHMEVLELSQRFFIALKRHNYVTPASYLELIRTYLSLLSRKRSEVSKQKFRYSNGLEKLDFAGKSVAKMQVDLEALQPQLIITKEETTQIMLQIEHESKDVNETRKVVAADEAVASKKAAEAKAIKEECENDLSEALPALNTALTALDTLKTNDITLIKSMKNPPAGVKLVMEAVCIMKEIKPVKVPDPSGSGKKIEDYWGPSKLLLGDLKFLEQLKAYDRDNIPAAVMKIIRAKYTNNSEFDPEKVKSASSAAEGLCRWVCAMEVYDRVAKVVAPKKEALTRAEEDLNTTIKSLREKQDVLKEVEKKMAALEGKFSEMNAKKEALEDQVKTISQQLERAEKLIGSLGDEKERWTKCASDLDAVYTQLTGDVLIASGVISYLGAFTKVYRDNCVSGWVRACKRLNIPCSEPFALAKVCGDAVTVRSWILDGLPNDAFSIDNGISVANARRWPLMIDPQGQANRWIKSKEKNAGLQVVKLSDSDYLRTLENAIQFGTPVLLENVGEELDPVLEPLLSKQTFKQGGVNCIRLGDSTIEYSSEFRFYITTKLRNPHYLPEISTKVTLLNFMITPEGLEDQLLGIVIAKEKPELEEAKNQLLLQSAENKRQLQEIENKILAILSASQGNILEDETAIQVLASSKILSKSITEKQIAAEQTEKDIDIVRLGYKPIASHASVLFFCIAVLANIEPMYQYSLAWYINLFVSSIEKSQKSKEIDERLQNLRNHFTESLYRNVCRSLFEKDKLAFSASLCATMLIAEGKISPSEWRFFLYGGARSTPPPESPPNPAPKWLSDSCWAQICQLPASGALKDIATKAAPHAEELKRVFLALSPQNSELPGPLRQLTDFQRLLFLKCIRFDKLVPILQRFIISAIGSQFVEPPQFDLAASYADAGQTTPLVFVLSPGADPMTSLLKFAEDRGVSGNKLNSISLGQGQGPIAAKLIAKGASDGSWIVLQNCHLAVSWMPQLEKICEELTFENTHPSFRLWLTSYPSDRFPVTILQNGVKMTNEPPKGLRANVLKNYLTDPICESGFHTGCSNQVAFERLLYALCFFHAVVQERRNFGPIGWNIPYEFNDTDLRISVRQLRNFLDEYSEVPFDALRYLTGHCNYGGRVTDDKDRRTLLSLLMQYYNPDVVGTEGYLLSSSGDYSIPADASYASCLKWIRSMPLEAKPDVFWLNDNADISKNQLEADCLLQAIQLTQENVTMSAGGEEGESGDDSSNEGSNEAAAPNSEKLVYDFAANMLERLPPPFDIEAISAKYPVQYQESMNTVLLQECIRYRNLVSVVSESLTSIQKALKGLVVMSSELEDTNRSMAAGRVPAMWLAKSYPSLRPLGSYFDDLLMRLDMFNKWYENGCPVLYWISGFFFTQSFLTGVLQNFARKYTIPIDQVLLDYQIMQTKVANVKPEDGVYVNGIYIEGACWAGSVLAEAKPKELYAELPVIWLKPVERSKMNEQQKEGNRQPKVGEQQMYYEAPVYKTLARRGTLSTTGHSTNYVMSMRLPSQHPEEHWINRGVACFLSLSK